MCHPATLPVSLLLNALIFSDLSGFLDFVRLERAESWLVRMKFIDEAIIKVRAGDGGRGCVSFRREKYVPRGGPDGGSGGKGGDVIFKASRHLSTLMDFRYQRVFQAGHGEHGLGSACDGRAGEDLLVPVPVGTVVFDADTGAVLADFTSDGQCLIIAKGGQGGRGNACFTSSTRQAPKFAQPGRPGEVRRVRLELKLLADVGLIGRPNAGKSTLLAAVSRARPKVADYPFTTLKPFLGVVQYQEAGSFVMADLPGLINGAHEGRGMGNAFLKHAERTRVLLHLVSVSPEETEAPWTRYEQISREVNTYFKKNRRGTPAPESLVLLTKTDLIGARELDALRDEFCLKTGTQPIPVSAVTRRGIDTVLDAVWRRL